MSGRGQNWRITSEKVLSECELNLVLSDLHSRVQRSRYTLNAMVNLAIIRLGAFAGLRASEQAGIRLSDVILLRERNRSRVKVPASCAKMGKARTALIWSEATVRDLERYMDLRVSQGAKRSDPFLCSMSSRSFGKPLTRQAIRLKTKTACKVLGKGRVESITAHTLRHCFCSKALASGVPLALVRDAAGHSSIAITNAYAHVWDDANADWTMD